MAQLTEKTFDLGLAMLSTSGLKIEEQLQVQAWWNLVNDMDDELFQRAIVTLCKEKEQWWPTDNVPAMIRERIKGITAEQNKLKRKLEDDQKQLEWKRDAADPPKNLKMPAFYANQIPQLRGENAKSK